MAHYIVCDWKGQPACDGFPGSRKIYTTSNLETAEYMCKVLNDNFNKGRDMDMFKFHYVTEDEDDIFNPKNLNEKTIIDWYNLINKYPKHSFIICDK
jgi:hypothetical protein